MSPAAVPRLPDRAVPPTALWGINRFFQTFREGLIVR